MNRSVLGTLGLSLWALAAVACAGASSGDVGSGQPQGSDEAHDGCDSDADCVVVQTACCDHCNGGKAEAFNKAHADKHRPRDCKGVACTRRGCGDVTAVCVNNTCQVEIQPL